MTKSVNRRARKMSNDSVWNWFEYSVSRENRTLYIGSFHKDEDDDTESGVDNFMTEYAVKGLDVLAGDSRKKPILLKMNNPGGDWFHGMAIFDAIRACEAPVDILGLGHVMSMGAVILQSGRKRLLYPNSVVMVHDGYQDAANRPVRSARAWSNFEEKCRRRMYGIFAQRSGYTSQFWSDKCSHDNLFTADEALKMGLADEIISPQGTPQMLVLPQKRFGNRNGQYEVGRNGSNHTSIGYEAKPQTTSRARR